LLQHLNTVVNDYVRAVAELAVVMAIVPQAEYEQMRATVEHCRF
jgi:hypothetical protein